MYLHIVFFCFQKEKQAGIRKLSNLTWIKQYFVIFWLKKHRRIIKKRTKKMDNKNGSRFLWKKKQKTKQTNFDTENFR